MFDRNTQLFAESIHRDLSFVTAARGTLFGIYAKYNLCRAKYYIRTAEYNHRPAEQYDTTVLRKY